MYVRIEDVHDIDRPDIPDGVIKMLRKCFAESEGRPVARVSDFALCITHICDFYRHVDEVKASISPYQIDRRCADIRIYAVRLRRI